MSYNKYYHPTTWEDFPSENTAIDAQRLNHLEDGVDELDDRICSLDVNKSQVSWNQQLLTGDKIAEISINGVVKSVYAPNVDGASQQAQAAALVSEGHAQGTQGGSAVGPGSQYYHNNAKYYAEQASTSFDNKIASEGYALGTENGDPVTSGSIYYHNNAKYYAEQARSFTPEGYQELVDEVEEKIDKSDVDVKSVTTGQFNTITGGLMQSCVVDLEPIQSGSGTPSPTNVRPISGHTQVQVGNCGKNKFPYPYLFSSTTRAGMTITAQSDGKIAVTGTSTSSVVERIDIQYVTLDVGSYIISGLFPKTGCYATLRDGDTGAWVANIETNSYALNVSSKKKYLIAINITSGNTTGVTYEPMIRKATDTDATFEPYNGYTTTINLGGTYYGGTLDAVSGVLTVTDAFVEITASNGEYASYLNRYLIRTSLLNLPNAKSSYEECICDKFEAKTLPQIEGGAVAVYAHNDIIAICNYKTSLADYQTFLTNNPVHVAYKVATPFTIQLTPTQLETLVGQNDVFAPLTGQSLDSLSYREVMAWDDVERAVAVKLDLSSVAPIEYTDKASQSYNQKQLFIKDNKLCQALASISSGASFTENTNFKYTTLAEIIEPLIP